MKREMQLEEVPNNRNYSISFKNMKQFRECGFGIDAAGLGPGDKFCDIHPSIGGFAIVDIALGFIEYFSDLTLRKTCFLTELPEVSRNQTIFQIVLGFCWHDINLS